MDAVPLLLSFLALSIVSMDLALSIVWTHRARYSWSWALIAFSASLLGAVVAFALDSAAYLAFTGTARMVLHYIWEGLMVAGLYLGVSVVWLILNIPLFSILQYAVWTLAVLYCVILLLHERKSIKEKSVRTACFALIIISFSMIPFVILAIFFSFFRMISIPIICLAYTIAELVFLFTAISHQSVVTPAAERPEFSFETASSLYHITEREFEVVSLIKKGLTNKEIAAELGISVNTVNNHIANIFAKTDVGSRIDLLNLLQEASW